MKIASWDPLDFKDRPLPATATEAVETLQALIMGESDALVVETAHGPRVFTLSDANEPYRQLIERMSQAAVVLSEGVVLYCNGGVSRALGRESITGERFADLVVDADRQRFCQFLIGCARAQADCEVALRMADGASMPARIGGAPMSFEGRDCLAIVVTPLNEIQSLKAAEEALRDADRRKDEFLAMLAHELRNPLGPIRNGVEILRSGVDAAKATRVHDIMARQVDHLVRLVDDLFEVSRFTQGLIELRKGRIDLAEVVRDAVAATQSLIAQHGHLLTVSLASEPLPLEADPTRLAQVVTNLIDNAAKFTRPGGRIEISARREDYEAVVSVQDNGAGIPADKLKCIFDLFMQVDSGLDHPTGGLGIGLALVRNLVEMHGGFVEAHSAGVGQGSEFVVRLPLAIATDATAPAAAAITVAAPDVVRRVLVVDDTEDVADALAMLLKTMNAEVRVAYGGRSALENAAAFKPEVVFVDIGMPDMDGYETARRLRQLPDGGGVLLVALTGWGQEEHRRRSREAGFDKHLIKPVSFDSVQALLEELC
jgi:signal transduction histidine kinase